MEIQTIEKNSLEGIKDAILSTLNVEEISEELKQQVSAYIVEEVVPVAMELADKTIEKLKEQAETASGWIKIRDGVVYPILIKAAINIVNTVLKKSVA